MFSKEIIDSDNYSIKYGIDFLGKTSRIVLFLNYLN